MSSIRSTRFLAFGEGIKDSIPLIIGAVPFGMIFGTVAVAKGFSPVGVVAMSLFVFAGSSQFVAIGLTAAGASLPVILFTTFVVNFRHLLYGAALSGYFSGISRTKKAFVAFLLTDECFAVVSARKQRDFDNEDIDQGFLWTYAIGSGLSIYTSWAVSTIAGICLGSSIPNLDAWGLDFAMPVTFLGMTIIGIRDTSTFIAAIIAAAAAALLFSLPNKLGLVIAVAIGVAAAAAAHPAVRRNSDE